MGGPDLLEQLREKAAALPADGPPAVGLARRRALQAVETVAAALRVDPTLAARDRCRDIDLLEELLRQIKPLARQVEREAERRRLVALPGTERDIARLGPASPLAGEELDALSHRCPELAEQIRGAALPDWNTPERTRERSARLLPSPEQLEDIAEQLRHAVQASLQLSHPDPEAVRLAALADQITLTTRHRRPRCAGPGCDRELDHAETGRPRRYCGAACRQRTRRLRTTTPASAGSAPHAGTTTPPAPPPAELPGRGWDDTDVCLWREDGRWGLSGPDGDIDVREFGLFGNDLNASDLKGAQAAAAEAVRSLTGRTITSWDRDAWSRSVYGPSSWFACLT